VLAFFKALPPCLVGIEACGTAHYWAREIRELGHEVRLMPCKRPIKMSPVCQLDGVTGQQPTVVVAVAVPQDDGVGKRSQAGPAPSINRGTTMEYYAGIDVSLESASLCVVDATGQIVCEAKLASEPEVLIGWFRDLGLAVIRIGLEAGPLSQWLYAGMRDAGLAVELLETRHVRNAFKAMPVKTDRKDARGIAQLMRLGWFRPVHCKSLPAQEVRALLTARKLLQTKNHDVEMSLRGVRPPEVPCCSTKERMGEITNFVRGLSSPTPFFGAQPGLQRLGASRSKLWASSKTASGSVNCPATSRASPARLSHSKASFNIDSIWSSLSSFVSCPFRSPNYVCVTKAASRPKMKPRVKSGSKARPTGAAPQ